MDGFVKAVERLDVAQLFVVSDIGEIAQRIPIARCRGSLLRRFFAFDRFVELAVGDDSLDKVITPAHPSSMQQVGDVGPPSLDRHVLVRV